jgi:hypothetical protein
VARVEQAWTTFSPTNPFAPVTATSILTPSIGAAPALVLSVVPLRRAEHVEERRRPMPRESEQATREEAGPPQMDDGEGVPENVARGDYALHDGLHSGAVSALHRERSARRFVTQKCRVTFAGGILHLTS